MLKRDKINDANHPFFEDANELYVSAFPEEERRPNDYHAEALKKAHFVAEVILDNDQFVGLMYWWNFTNFRYIEHFAISEALRGRKIGERALIAFLQENKKSVLLEVEIPHEEIQRKRIAFYQRYGFHLSSLPYQQPPYRPGVNFLPLHIMTYPEHITEQQLADFVNNCHPLIHFKYPFKTNIF